MNEISAQYFSLIVDEVTDVAHNEQVYIAVRLVDSSYNVQETSLGLVQLPETKALPVFSAIKYVLIWCYLPTSNCIGQVYDGVPKMSEVRNGVQALMKKRIVAAFLFTALHIV